MPKPIVTSIEYSSEEGVFTGEIWSNGPLPSSFWVFPHPDHSVSEEDLISRMILVYKGKQVNQDNGSNSAILAFIRAGEIARKTNHVAYDGDRYRRGLVDSDLKGSNFRPPFRVVYPFDYRQKSFFISPAELELNQRADLGVQQSWKFS